MIEDFYNSDVIVKQVLRTQTPMGGVKKSYSDRIASLKCRITAKRIREADEFGKITIREVWRLYCDASSTTNAIVESDRIIAGSKTFEVTGIANPGLLNHHLEIDLLEIK